MYDLGFRIKEIRTRRGLNQKELAQRISKPCLNSMSRARLMWKPTRPKKQSVTQPS